MLENILERDWNISDQAQVKAWSHAGSFAVWQQDMTVAQRIINHNLERARALNDQSEAAFNLHQLGNVAFLAGDMEKADELQKTSIVLSREIDATWVMAMAQVALGYQEQVLGNLPRSEELYMESLNHCRQLGEKWGMEIILGNLAMIFYSKGDKLAAKRTFMESLDLAMELGNTHGTLSILAGITKVIQETGELIASARLQGMIAVKGKELALPLERVEQDMYDSAANALKESMGEQAYQTEFEIGMMLTLEDALDLVRKRN